MVGYGIKKSGDDGFIIAMAAFIGVLNIHNLNCLMKFNQNRF